MTAEERAARRAELEAAEAKRKEARAEERADLELERLELKDRFERELGEEGKAWLMYDATHLGAGFLVVKAGLPVLFTRYIESKMTSVDKFDFVIQHVAHPDQAKFIALQSQRPALNMELANRLASLYGINAKFEEGK